MNNQNAYKHFVSESLNIPESLDAYWDIIDIYPEDNPKLALAHYNDGFDFTNRSHGPLTKLRGVIVDLNTGAVVADSYGYNQTLPCNGSIEETQDKIIINTTKSVYLNDPKAAPDEAAKLTVGDVEFDKEKTKLFVGYEGAIVRVFRWGGETFFSTHRKISGVKSAWSARKSFYELYNEMGGPLIDSLFGDEEYSPFCYMFYIANDELRLAGSTRDNRLLFLGVKKVWDEQKYAHGDDDKHGPYWYYNSFEVKYPKFTEEPSAFSTELNRGFIPQEPISVDIANKFLFPNEFATPIPDNDETRNYDPLPNELVIDYSNDGEVKDIYFNYPENKIRDDRLKGGDFIIMYTQDEQGNTIVNRLEPSSFLYRSSIIDNDPNLYHRFVVKMVEFTQSEPSELTSKYPTFIGQNGRELELETPQTRQVYWWSIFHDAVAPSFKKDTEEYLSKYQKDIQNIANFILYEFKKIIDEEERKRIKPETENRFKNLLARARSRSSQYGRKVSPFGKLKGLLYNETGPSLYKMISTIRDIKKYREKQ